MVGEESTLVGFESCLCIFRPLVHGFEGEKSDLALGADLQVQQSLSFSVFLCFLMLCVLDS